MSLFDDVQAALSAMILSHSGWRGIFAGGGEEDKSREISLARRVIAAGAAEAFAGYLSRLAKSSEKPLVLIGCDTRPTGRAIAGAIIPALLSCGCRVSFAGTVAAPEIMAWARCAQSANAGFMYVSASHNPIGHNGLKFGLNDGGVLSADEAGKLTAQFRSLMANQDNVRRLELIISQADQNALREVYAGEASAKKEAYGAYYRFNAEVVWGSGGDDAESALRQNIALRPLGICCDFNGSARSASIDREFLGGLGIQLETLNAIPGEIAHRIVPEGESLEPCRVFLEDLHRRNPAFIMGYVPDCDGDRGNLVIWDESVQKARALEAQEVFALACIAELSFLAWKSGLPLQKSAIVVNDPTSLRIDRIAQSFGISVFRAEVGEANAVGLARKLRNEGYTVRILGEGSNGGNITHPSAVRDPIHTVLAMVKLLSLRTGRNGAGIFEIWCRASGVAYNDQFSLADVIASLPPFATTSAYSPEAALSVRSTDHGELKRRYQHIFLRQWEEKKAELLDRFGIHRWEACAYNGIVERRGIGDFGEAGKGGLSICFYDAADSPAAWIWMRGSATEPVFRVMADIRGADRRAERCLIEWQRSMTIEADRS